MKNLCYMRDKPSVPHLHAKFCASTKFRIIREDETETENLQLILH